MSDEYVTVTKGSRVRVERLRVGDLAGLAGMQTKFDGLKQAFEGTVRHVRGDGPTVATSTVVRLYVEVSADEPGALHCDRCGTHEAEVDPRHVVAVLG